MYLKIKTVTTATTRMDENKIFRTIMLWHAPDRN